MTLIEQTDASGQILAQYEGILTILETIITDHRLDTGFIEFGFEPRLLESLLLASYQIQYLNSYYNWNELLGHLMKITNNQLICRLKDIDVQLKLYELFLLSQLTDSELLNNLLPLWLEQFSEIVTSLFLTDIKQYRLRKVAVFYIIAVYTAFGKARVFLLQKSIEKLTPYYSQLMVSQTEEDAWRTIYKLIFQLLSNSLRSNQTSKTDYLPILTQLYGLQSEDGSWQKNNLLTLLVIHTLRTNTELQLLAAEPLKRAESYLSQFLTSGISVLTSMKLFNTQLFNVVYYHIHKRLSNIAAAQLLLKSLVQTQNTDGGIPLQPFFQLSDFDTTAFSILFAVSMPNTIESQLIIEKGVKFIESLMNNGKCTMYRQSTENLPEMVARAIMIYSTLPFQYISDANRSQQLLACLNTLIESQSQSGEFIYSAYSSSPFYAIMQVCSALKYLRQSPYINIQEYLPKIELLEKRMKIFLITRQNTNGSYNSLASNDSGEQQSTCYACISLNMLNDAGATAKAIAWLASFIDKHQIQSFPEATGPRPIRYNDLSHGPLFLYFAFAYYYFSEE